MAIESGQVEGKKSSKKKTKVNPGAEMAESAGELNVADAGTTPEVIKDGAVVDTSGETEVESEDMIRAKQLHQRALAAKGNSDESMFTLAEALEEIYTSNLYIKLGYKTWAPYVEENFGFTVRKAQEVIGINQYFGKKLAAYPEVKQAVKQLGWSKARLLVDVADQTNYKEMVNKALTMTVIQLEAEARNKLKELEAAAKGTKAEKEPTDLKAFTVKLSTDQRANVEKALEKASTTSKSDKKGNNLDLIATAFLSDTVGADDEDAIRALFKKMENLTGLKIVATTQDLNVVYGSKYLDEFATAAQA